MQAVIAGASSDLGPVIKAHESSYQDLLSAD
jgi:hypothetical protein